MKKSDYSEISTLDELRRARMKVEIRSSQAKKSIDNSWDGLKKSLSFANLATSMLANVTVLFTEAEYFRRGYTWVRDFLEKESQAKSMKKDEACIEEADADNAIGNTAVENDS